MYKTFPARSLTLAVTLTDLEISTLKLQNQEMTVAFLIGEAVKQSVLFIVASSRMVFTLPNQVETCLFSFLQLNLLET